MNKETKTALWISSWYAFFGSAWIIVSDSIVSKHNHDFMTLIYNMSKGLTFVAVTAFFLCITIRKHMRKEREHQASELEALRQVNSLQDDIQKMLLEQTAVFENDAIGIAIVENRRVMKSNDRFAEIVGRNDSHSCFALDEFNTMFDTRMHSQEFELNRKDGTRCWCQMITNQLENERTVVFLQDISERKEAERNIEHLAYFDFLTNLPNRVLMRDRLGVAIDRARRDNDRVGLLFLDLDDFKLVNDTFGHQTGYKLLQKVAARITETLRTTDTIARMGGDEFVVIIDGDASDIAMSIVARKITSALEQPFDLGEENEVFIGASIGIAMFPDDADHADELLKDADIAMYKAKDAGRNSYKFYNPSMNLRTEDRMFIETNLRYALERQEFHLEYQPFYDLTTGSISGMEALCRWNHPVHGNITPDKFIPVAEENGLIIPLGEWVLNKACCDVKKLHDIGILGAKVAVNISGRQMKHTDIAKTVKRAIDVSGVEPWAIELELTESTIMENVDESLKILNDFIKLGVKIAVDDFGTGYSSLSYLKHFPVDKLKIDKGFVDGVIANEYDASIVRVIIALADTLGISVIGEGVETPEQLQFLKNEGCQEIQGYLLGKPMKFDAMTKFLLEFNKYEFEKKNIIDIKADVC